MNKNFCIALDIDTINTHSLCGVRSLIVILIKVVVMTNQEKEVS